MASSASNGTERAAYVVASTMHPIDALIYIFLYTMEASLLFYGHTTTPPLAYTAEAVKVWLRRSVSLPVSVAHRLQHQFTTILSACGQHQSRLSVYFDRVLSRNFPLPSRTGVYSQLMSYIDRHSHTLFTRRVLTKKSRGVRTSSFWAARLIYDVSVCLPDSVSRLVTHAVVARPAAYSVFCEVIACFRAGVTVPVAASAGPLSYSPLLILNSLSHWASAIEFCGSADESASGGHHGGGRASTVVSSEDKARAELVASRLDPCVLLWACRAMVASVIMDCRVLCEQLDDVPGRMQGVVTFLDAAFSCVSVSKPAMPPVLLSSTHSRACLHDPVDFLYTVLPPSVRSDFPAGLDPDVSLALFEWIYDRRSLFYETYDPESVYSPVSTDSIGASMVDAYTCVYRMCYLYCVAVGVEPGPVVSVLTAAFRVPYEQAFVESAVAACISLGSAGVLGSFVTGMRSLSQVVPVPLDDGHRLAVADAIAAHRPEKPAMHRCPVLAWCIHCERVRTAVESAEPVISRRVRPSAHFDADVDMPSVSGRRPPMYGYVNVVFNARDVDDPGVVGFVACDGRASPDCARTPLVAISMVRDALYLRGVYYRVCVGCAAVICVDGSTSWRGSGPVCRRCIVTQPRPFLVRKTTHAVPRYTAFNFVKSFITYSVDRTRKKQ